MPRYRTAEHRLFQAEGRDFLFLCAENAVFEVDGEMRSILERCASPSGRTREEILGLLDGPFEEREEELRDLLQCRLLAPAASDAPSSPRNASPKEIPVKTLVLHVTDDCNLACDYCYRANGSEGAKAATMTEETARKAVDFLFEGSGGLDEVVLVLFGGEPLLNMGALEAAVARGRLGSEETGKKLSLAMTTNGTLFSEKTVDFIRENRIGVTVSVDGEPETHDRCRRFPGGAPSYGAVARGLRRLLRDSMEKPVVARATVTRQVPDLSRSLHHLLDLGLAEAGFAPVTSGDPAYRLDEEDMTRLLEQFQQLSQEFVRTALDGGFLGFTNLVDLLVSLHEGEVKTHACGAGLGLFSVDPRGALYLCQRLTGEACARMGSLREGLDLAKVEAFRGEAALERRGECKECWARTLCAGGCYHEALVRQEGLTRPNSHYCRWIQDWIRTGLEVYGRLAVRDPEYLDRLSLLRGHQPTIPSIL